MDAKDVKLPTGYAGADATPKDARLNLRISWSWQTPAPVPLEWADEDGRRLEKRLSEIAAGVLVAGEFMYRENVLWHHEFDIAERRRLLEESRKRAAEAERKERERLLKLKADRRQQLVADAGNWRRAAEIREYVQATMARLGEICAEDNAWIAWALAEADQMDPLTEGG